MSKSNTLKKDASEKETTPVETTKVDIRKEMSAEEAEKIVAREKGELKEEIKEEIKEEPKEEVKEEIKEEVKEEPKELPKELPERYKGKTPEELVGLLEEKEKFIQSRSDEIGDWKKKVKEAEVLSQKVSKIEEESMKQTPGTMPKKPVKPVITDQEYYDNPVGSLNKLADYQEKAMEYADQVSSAKTAPFYQGDMERRREKIYNGLEEKYKDSPVKFDRKKVQEFLNKNPEYFKQYKVNAYEQAYHDISVPDLSKSREKIREEVREEVKAEVIAEMKTNKQATSVGFNDLETPQKATVTEYDKVKMEEDPEYRNQVIADMEEKKRKGKI